MKQQIIPIPKKSEITAGTSFHEQIVKAWQALVDLLQDEMKNPNLDPLAKARAWVEYIQRNDELKYKKQTLESYLQRCTAWNIEWEARYKAMNEVFDAAHEKAAALEFQTENLKGVLNIWKTAPEEKRTDNEFRYRIWATIDQELTIKPLKKI